MDADALMHAVLYGTRPDPDAAAKRRIAELERELAELKAEQERDVRAITVKAEAR